MSRSRSHRHPLLESVEARLLMTVQSSVDDDAVRMHVQGSNNFLFISYDPASNRLKHNRFGTGDPGYVSEFDFDWFASGTQSLTPGPDTHIIYTDSSYSGVCVVSDADRPYGSHYTVDGSVYTWGDGTTFDLDARLQYRRLTTTNFDDFVFVNSIQDQDSLFDIYTFDGNDRIEVGSAGTLDTVLGPVSVVGGDGVDTIVINDTADTTVGNHYTITPTSTERENAPYPIDYEQIEAARLLGSTKADSIGVFTSAAMPNAEVSGNAGADSIFVYDSVNPVTVHGGAGLDTLTVNSNGSNPASAQLTGKEDFESINILAGGRVNVAPGGNNTLECKLLSASGVLDLADNALISHTSNWNPWMFNSLLQKGYNAGEWNGTSGIVSSTAAASPINDGIGFASGQQAGVGTYAGVGVEPTHLIVTHTLMGDTNLDHKVDFTDLLSLAQNYGLPAKLWHQGNVDYDLSGDVKFSDLLIVAQNYGNSALANRGRREAIAAQVIV